MKRTLFSLSFLLLFLFGMGKGPFLPDLRSINDTQWGMGNFFPHWAGILAALVLGTFLFFGFRGWCRWIQDSFLKGTEDGEGALLGWAIALVLFFAFTWALAIHGLLYPPLVAMFFLPAVLPGWRAKGSRPKGFSSPLFPVLLLTAAGILWVLEFLSPPLIWDAVLDHFRFAAEVARLHQLPVTWVNHTGDMPKGAEILWAGLWSLGGEPLSKFGSILPSVLTLCLLWILGGKMKAPGWVLGSLFLTCPFFLAVFSWGYVEGWLAFYEVLALYCFWKQIRDPGTRLWQRLTAFFLGSALSIKYTAVLAIAPILILALGARWVLKTRWKLDPLLLPLFLLPAGPWLLKNVLVFGNPFYPLAMGLFGSEVGYSLQMGSNLWKDTGLPSEGSLASVLAGFWKAFFTGSNGVGAAWTPLALMGLPWVLSKPLPKFTGPFFLFFVAFMAGWAVFCTGLRHAAGAMLVLGILGALGWAAALRTGGTLVKWVFGSASLLSLWLCICAQLTATAPLASALGLEDPLDRLKRHYTFSKDTYAAYRLIEKNSRDRDKVMAFGVFQVYPLQRTAFVDFKWNQPIFLQWASENPTAEGLAERFRREGVRYFLYQRQEAMAFSKVSAEFQLEGMAVQEYAGFWRMYMEEVAAFGEVRVFRTRPSPKPRPMEERDMPYLRERGPGALVLSKGGVTQDVLLKPAFQRDAKVLDLSEVPEFVKAGDHPVPQSDR